MTRNISTVGAVQLCQFTGSAGLNSFRPAAHGSSPRLSCELQGLNNCSAEGRKRRAALGLGKPLRQVQGILQYKVAAHSQVVRRFAQGVRWSYAETEPYGKTLWERTYLVGWLVPRLRWAALPLAQTLSSAPCSTWPTTSCWAVSKRKWFIAEKLEQCLNYHSRAAMRLTCPLRCRRQSLTRRGQQQAVVVAQYPISLCSTK